MGWRAEWRVIRMLETRGRSQKSERGAGAACGQRFHLARASSAKTRGFHTQLDKGPETP